VAEKQTIARQVASRTQPRTAAVAAFYCLAAGDQPAADKWLQAAGDKAAVVKRAFR
jgi:hypothetical protein